MDNLPAIREQDLPADWRSRDREWIATFDANGVVGRVKLFNAKQAADLKPEDSKGNPLHVVDAVIHKVSATDEATGEVREWAAITLELITQRTLRINSKPAIRSFLEIVKTFGMELLRSGTVLLVVTGTPSKKWGKDWYSLAAKVGTDVTNATEHNS